MIKVTTNNVLETQNLAKQLGEGLHGGEVIILNGQLGAGKTTFTKGIAEALGIRDIITSPTFTIMKEYYGKLNLCHFDMYRIEDSSELEELGVTDNLFDKDTVCVIEWSKLDNSDEYITIDFEYIDESRREITIKGAYHEFSCN